MQGSNEAHDQGDAHVTRIRQTHSSRALHPAVLSRHFSAAVEHREADAADAAARIAGNFYGVTLPVGGSYALGIAELIVSLALLVGFYRTISYGLSLLIHTVTVVVSWRQLFDPWGLAKVGNHLWISTWPTWGGFAALFLMREWDTWTLDGWRQTRSGLLPTDQAV